MNASRRAVLTAAVAMMLAGTTTSTMLAQSPENAAVEQAGETLRKLMINPDHPALERIFADRLSYGHSDGRVQTKAEFIDALVNGKSVFKSIFAVQPDPLPGGRYRDRTAPLRGRRDQQRRTGTAAHQGVAGMAEAE